VYGQRELRTHLLERQARARQELKGLEPDYVLSENEDVLIAGLLDKHLPDPVSVDWGAATRSPISETLVQQYDYFNHGASKAVSGSSLTITVPVSGDGELLNFQASTFNLSGPPDGARIGKSQIEITISEHRLSAELIQGRFEGLRGQIDQKAAWANNDVDQARAEADRVLRADLERRKQRLLHDRALESALNIPVQVSGAPRQPVPARRRTVTLEHRRQQAAFTPEPTLDQAIYEDILTQVEAWATNLERTPGTLAKLSEEELRDLLLGTLNGYWQGAAGGELFNGNGKTDILVRHDNRNVFIGECKIWRGPQAAAEALDQLLGYLVWRDSKAALVMFIKNRTPAETIRRLHQAVAAHPNWRLTKANGDPARRVDYVVAADDEGRRISLAVLPVVLDARHARGQDGAS
jgi:hypothetical protein